MHPGIIIELNLLRLDMLELLYVSRESLYLKPLEQVCRPLFKLSLWKMDYIFQQMGLQASMQDLQNSQIWQLPRD